VSQDLGSVLQDLIPEVILSQKSLVHMGLIFNSYEAMSICSKLNKLEKKEVHCVLNEIGC
jgi:hypothetical protein